MAGEQNNEKAGSGPATWEDNMREGRNKTVQANITQCVTVTSLFCDSVVQRARMFK